MNNTQQHIALLKKLYRGTTIQAVWRLVPSVVRNCSICDTDIRVVKLQDLGDTKGKTYRCEKCLLSEIDTDIRNRFGNDYELVVDYIRVSWFMTNDECRLEFKRDISCRLRTIAPILLFTPCFIDRDVPHVLRDSMSLVHYLTMYVLGCGNVTG